MRPLKRKKLDRIGLDGIESGGKRYRGGGHTSGQKKKISRRQMAELYGDLRRGTTTEIGR